MVNTRPQFLERSAIQFAFIKHDLNGVFAGILRLISVRVVNGIQHGNDIGSAFSGFFWNGDCTILFVLIIFLGQFAAFYIPVFYQALMYGTGCILAELFYKQLCFHLERTVSHRFGNFALQSLGEAVVAFVGDNCQHIDVVNFLTGEDGFIHALAVLIDGKPKPAADFLSLADIASALL